MSKSKYPSYNGEAKKERGVEMGYWQSLVSLIGDNFPSQPAQEDAVVVEDIAKTDERSHIRSRSIHRKGRSMSSFRTARNGGYPRQSQAASARVHRTSRHTGGILLIVILVHRFLRFIDLLERLPLVATGNS
ncbi:Os11g0270760 [Oryza sativa Japonica Group]|uniref:Os11g0270760 protein n=2 Tax=Oryza sativa subsp. japonica TaxID=39947 RepID=Q53N69_ORYSJ|nr:hypothetical protein LOC_Os11g17030 [Oryza sativa Japonica Group]ABA92662.1 hypothetical protein LOC_Os11g17030 [Oryza sativa Japonica Group]EAZ18055.1 hypothetical protein OsJ_33601 [Oryza sativa Japonica Group]KAB8114922.1 hypothetical protein EE612_054699 [Oryza sativa]BAT13560.1 Os11g0270760 [Oryza sativa Japonica Group]